MYDPNDPNSYAGPTVVPPGHPTQVQPTGPASGPGVGGGVPTVSNPFKNDPKDFMAAPVMKAFQPSVGPEPLKGDPNIHGKRGQIQADKISAANQKQDQAFVNQQANASAQNDEANDDRQQAFQNSVDAARKQNDAKAQQWTEQQKAAGKTEYSDGTFGPKKNPDGSMQAASGGAVRQIGVRQIGPTGRGASSCSDGVCSGSASGPNVGIPKPPKPDFGKTGYGTAVQEFAEGGEVERSDDPLKEGKDGRVKVPPIGSGPFGPYRPPWGNQPVKGFAAGGPVESDHLMQGGQAYDDARHGMRKMFMGGVKTPQTSQHAQRYFGRHDAEDTHTVLPAAINNVIKAKGLQGQPNAVAHAAHHIMAAAGRAYAEGGEVEAQDPWSNDAAKTAQTFAHAQGQHYAHAAHLLDQGKNDEAARVAEMGTQLNPGSDPMRFDAHENGFTATPVDLGSGRGGAPINLTREQFAHALAMNTDLHSYGPASWHHASTIPPGQEKTHRHYAQGGLVRAEDGGDPANADDPQAHKQPHERESDNKIIKGLERAFTIPGKLREGLAKSDIVGDIVSAPGMEQAIHDVTGSYARGQEAPPQPDIGNRQSQVSDEGPAFGRRAQVKPYQGQKTDQLIPDIGPYAKRGLGQEGERGLDEGAFNPEPMETTRRPLERGIPDATAQSVSPRVVPKEQTPNYRGSVMPNTQDVAQQGQFNRYMGDRPQSNPSEVWQGVQQANNASARPLPGTVPDAQVGPQRPPNVAPMRGQGIPAPNQPPLPGPAQVQNAQQQGPQVQHPRDVGHDWWDSPADKILPLTQPGHAAHTQMTQSQLQQMDQLGIRARQSGRTPREQYEFERQQQGPAVPPQFGGQRMPSPQQPVPQGPPQAGIPPPGSPPPQQPVNPYRVGAPVGPQPNTLGPEGVRGNINQPRIIRGGQVTSGPQFRQEGRMANDQERPTPAQFSDEAFQAMAKIDPDFGRKITLWASDPQARKADPNFPHRLMEYTISQPEAEQRLKAAFGGRLPQGTESVVKQTGHNGTTYEQRDVNPADAYYGEAFKRSLMPDPSSAAGTRASGVRDNQAAKLAEAARAAFIAQYPEDKAGADREYAETYKRNGGQGTPQGGAQSPDPGKLQPNPDGTATMTGPNGEKAIYVWDPNKHKYVLK